MDGWMDKRLDTWVDGRIERKLNEHVLLPADLLSKPYALPHNHLSSPFLSISVSPPSALPFLHFLIPKLSNQLSLFSCPFSEKRFFLMISALFPDTPFSSAQVILNITLIAHITYSMIFVSPSSNSAHGVCTLQSIVEASIYQVAVICQA